MFTGIIESTASVASLERQEKTATLTLREVPFATDLTLGESVAINGVCLTVTSTTNGLVTFDLLAETLRATSLGDLAPGSLVNLERALPAGGRLSGHIVQGHVDTTAEILAYQQDGNDHRLEITLPKKFAHYLCYKGSVAIDGISLTVAAVDDIKGSFTLWIIPHTNDVTHLHTRTAGNRVNLEFDILAKYLERFQTARNSQAPPATG
ncbi:MAG: riboflavin synthase [Verrucomicrobiales bacterium]|nr:riboflavin synthase [Verrucomicrobiales bacterium]